VSLWFLAVDLLEDKPQRQLDDARLRLCGAAGTGNLAESAAGDGGIWISEQRMVQRVEHVRTELQLYPFIDVRPFSDAQIDVGPCGSAECIPAARPVCAL